MSRGTLRRSPLPPRSYCPKISGNPCLFPTTTIFVLGLLARASVASIPFHTSNCSSMSLRTTS